MPVSIRRHRKAWGTLSLLLSISLSLSLPAPAAQTRPGTAAAQAKQASAFYPARLIARARENAANYEWAAAIQRPIVDAAQPWVKLSDDELWNLVFGNTIKRSWMVWSDGWCPACRKPVPMYNWKMAALERPWKVWCPHCKEVFPKNDFEKYYRSGLNEHNVFDPKKADRKLLFNVEHPDLADPLHAFGVDDGEGFVQDARRWRFIGAYLIYGQWKQAIVAGARSLAAAYVVTGEKAYAHKAGILLDRVADLYPTFDFAKEGVLYEGPGARGYVSTWHDACVEVRDLAVAYDQVFEAMREDRELVKVLGAKARQFGIANPKSSFDDVRRNIEERILRDTLANRPKIESNYPQTDMAITMIKTVLGWPANREEVWGLMDAMLQTATEVDGVSGEKGLAGYAVIAPHSMAELLGRYARVEPGFLKEAFRRQPRLREMYRFHLDAWCLGKYYPRIGDTGSFATPTERYMGVELSKNPGLNPSGWQFLWGLHELTGDADFARVMYQANGESVEGLPYDLFAEDPAGMQARVKEVIAAAGPEIRTGSVNKQRWCLGLLRSGQGADARAVWLDYDGGGRHGHLDAMNLGIFAKGLDLLPDFGYPPVNYGGWGAPRAVWYATTAAHNSILVDNQNSRAGSGRCTLWCNGKKSRAIRASAPELIGGSQYERTVMMVDTGPRDFYVLDVFRVVGGSEHARLTHGPTATLITDGLSLSPADKPPVSGPAIQMRNFRQDASPRGAWSADFKVQDRFKLLPAGADVHLQCTDLTAGAEAFAAESWVSLGGFTVPEEAWIPSLIVRRQGKAPLASTFVSVIEPYEKSSGITRIRRLPLETEDGTTWPEANVCVEVTLADGRRDLLIAADVENPLGRKPGHGDKHLLVQKETGLRLDGRMCLVRLDTTGNPVLISAGRTSSLGCGDLSMRLKPDSDFVEVSLDHDSVVILTGEGLVEDIQIARQSTRIQQEALQR